MRPFDNALQTFPYLSRVEWECLDNIGGEIGPLQDPGPFPTSTAQLRFGRSETYDLEGFAAGQFNDWNDFLRYRNNFEQSGVPGKITRGALVDSSNDYETMRMEGCFVHKVETPVDLSGGKSVPTFELGLHCDKMIWKRVGGEPAWMTDWFLNGPQGHIFTRASARCGETRYSRKWRRCGNEAISFSGFRSEPCGLDHFYVQSNVATFVIHKVPDQFGPRWSSQLGLEYESAGGCFPRDKTRVTITELVSFVLGRRLVHIGTTVFDKDGFPVEVIAKQPWGDNLQAICRMEDFPPIGICRGDQNAEDVIAGLLPRYVELRDTLRLGDVLWRYWLGNEASLVSRLPIYSAGLEMLCTAWFKSSASKTKGVYMPKEKFDRFLMEEFHLIEARLSGIEHGERILRRMKNAYQTGSNERIEWFLEEIGLPVGSHERAAIYARNPTAHGAGGSSHPEVDALIRHTRAYRTLLARTLLKVLGYSGKYTDRCTEDFPNRDLDTPAGQ